MNEAEAAQRLGVDQNDVVEVREHDDGHLVVLADRQVVINAAGTQYPYRGDDTDDEDEQPAETSPTGESDDADEDEQPADPKPTGTKTRRARRGR